MSELLRNELRYPALALAHAAGRANRWLRGEWRPLLFWLALVALLALLAERLLGYGFGALFGWGQVLAVYTAALLAWWVLRARRRLVIEEFIDHTGGPEKSAARGLSTLLSVELTRLRALFSTADEQRAVSTATNTGSMQNIEATVKAEDVSDFVKSSVSAESKFSLGPLTIPVGTLMALFGRLAQGPRIAGSLHRSDGRLLLTAQLLGGARAASWRVDARGPDASPEALVGELASHVFTDLALGGAAKYKAVASFCNGLRVYRDCLRQSKDRLLNLRRAERSFIETVTEDATFYMAFYNLGVVYTELRQPDAAEVAFKRSIEQSPERWEPYFALALNHYYAKKYESAVLLCNRVLALDPGLANSARALGLKGSAQRMQYWDVDRRRALEGATRSRSEAVSKAWRALCLAELRGRSPGAGENLANSPRSLAAHCLVNLAVTHTYFAESAEAREKAHHVRTAVGLFRLAARVKPSDPTIYFEMGKTFSLGGEHEHAAWALERAAQIAPANADVWAHLALAYAHQGDRERAALACEKVFALISGATDAGLWAAAEACQKLGDGKQEQRFRSVRPFRELIERADGEGESALDLLRQVLRAAALEGDDWKVGRAAAALSRLHAAAGRLPRATAYLRLSIRKFADKYPREISEQSLYAQLAGLLMQRGENEKALQEAERAVGLDPLNAFERHVLGQVYSNMNQFEQARQEYEKALMWEPDEPSAHVNIGFTYVQTSMNCRDPERRKRASDVGIDFLRRALALYPSRNLLEKGSLHHYLGILHYNSLGFESAVSDFTTARTLRYARLETTLYLALAYIKNKAYNKADEQLRQIIGEADEAARNPAKLGQLTKEGAAQWMSLPQVFATAHCTLGFLYAERDVRHDEALGLVDKARGLIAAIPDEAGRRQVEAFCDDTQGWVLFKRDRIDDAVRLLERAAATGAEAVFYLHLALAAERQAAAEDDRKRALSLAARAQAHCRLALELDVTGEYAQPLGELRLRLHETVARLQAPPPK